nr:MAG TPA: hypothetical protein [Caudoviricetes sp.]
MQAFNYNIIIPQVESKVKYNFQEAVNRPSRSLGPFRGNRPSRSLGPSKSNPSSFQVKSKANKFRIVVDRVCG